MTQLENIVEQVRVFATQHTPRELVTQELPLALIVLLAGITVSVLGAKLARWGLTAAFVTAGALAGAECGRVAGFPPVLCGVGGAALIGIIGHLTFRLWAGAIAAGVFCAAALGVFGYYRIMPHLPEFQERMSVASQPSEGTFSLPTPQQQDAYLQRSPKQWAEELWAFAVSKDAQLQAHALAIGVAAVLTGLLFGLVATRTAMILSTSLIGTLLVAGSAGFLTRMGAPTAYQALLQRPQLSLMGIGGFLLTSLVLQALLTRKAAAPLRSAPTV